MSESQISKSQIANSLNLHIDSKSPTHQISRFTSRFTALDLALLVMVLIWGANFSVIKFALREFPQIAFNALRLVLAATVFLAAIAGAPRSDPPLSRADRHRIIILGIVGHFLYQLMFVAGVARTTASNSALIFGVTPIAVALLASILGHERIRPRQWFGAALSVAGIFVIVGQHATLSSETLLGDALVFCGMLCWSTYSVLSQPLLKRHSPLMVTGYSIALGAALYFLVALPTLLATDWRAISMVSWTLMVLSSLLALAFAYMVWYTAVQRIGSSRTAIYSNVTPIVALVVAAIWLGEPLGPAQIAGAAMILSGLFITRFTRHAPPQEA